MQNYSFALTCSPQFRPIIQMILILEQFLHVGCPCSPNHSVKQFKRMNEKLWSQECIQIAGNNSKVVNNQHTHILSLSCRDLCRSFYQEPCIPFLASPEDSVMVLVLIESHSNFQHQTCRTTNNWHRNTDWRTTTQQLWTSWWHFTLQILPT